MIYRRTLAHLLRQAALYGIATPPDVTNGIHEARAEIKRIKILLRAARVSVANMPDDAPETYSRPNEGALHPAKSPPRNMVTSIVVIVIGIIILTFIIRGVQFEPMPNATLTAATTNTTSSIIPTMWPLPSAQELPQATPSLVSIGTVLEANGWGYSFPNICTISCATVADQIGGYTADGRYVIILVVVINRTGIKQPMPVDFFAMRDAQGQIYQQLPKISDAYHKAYRFMADRSIVDDIPADALQTSIPLIFDVPLGASNLILFSRYNQNQGWLVLNKIP